MEQRAKTEMEGWVRFVYRRKGVPRRGGPHEPDHGDENGRACWKYSEWTSLSEVEGLGRRIRAKFL